MNEEMISFWSFSIVLALKSETIANLIGVWVYYNKNNLVNMLVLGN